MCIVVLSYLNDMLEDLSCIIVLVMIVLKGSSLLLLTGECLCAFGYGICCNFTYIYGKITWLSLTDCAYIAYKGDKGTHRYKFTKGIRTFTSEL